ncbi:MAG: tetratricopeptide repeat protein [Candidatus Firestonebacteria bacterium]
MNKKDQSKIYLLLLAFILLQVGEYFISYTLESSVVCTRVSLRTFDSKFFSDELKPLNRGFVHLLRRDLYCVKEFAVLGEEDVSDEVMGVIPNDKNNIQEASMKGLEDGVDKVIFGTISEGMKKDSILIEVQIIDANFESMDTIQLSGKIKDILKLEKDLILEIIKKLGVPLSIDEKKRIERYQTNSFDAFLLYSTGIDYAIKLDKMTYDFEEKSLQDNMRVKIGEIRVKTYDFFARAIKIDPQFAMPHFRIATILYTVGKIQECIKEQNIGLKLDPDDALAYWKCGLTYKYGFDKPQWIEAEPLFRRALEIAPNFYNAHLSIGSIYSDKGYLDKAVAEGKLAAELMPSSPWPYNSLGSYYCNANKIEESIMEFKKALEIKHNFLNSLRGLGFCYYKKGDYDNAILNYNKVVELTLDFFAYYRRGVVYFSKGEYDRAISDYNKAIELNPEYVNAYIDRGVAYEKKGDYDTTILNYNKAIELDSKLALVYYNRGLIYYYKTEYDKAISDYNKAIELDPKHMTTYVNRGIVYDRKGDYNAAISDFNKAIELDSKYAITYSNMGWVYEKKGLLGEAVWCYKKAVELDSNEKFAKSKLKNPSLSNIEPKQPD